MLKNIEKTENIVTYLETSGQGRIQTGRLHNKKPTATTSGPVPTTALFVFLALSYYASTKEMGSKALDRVFLRHSRNTKLPLLLQRLFGSLCGYTKRTVGRVKESVTGVLTNIDRFFWHSSLTLLLQKPSGTLFTILGHACTRVSINT
jgi:hypothetical protein